MDLVDDLRQILHDKPTSVVFVVGAGVSLGATRGSPAQPLAAWDGLLRSGLQRAHELRKLTAEELAHYDHQLGYPRVNDLLLVAGVVEQELGAPGGGEFRRWLRETVGSFEKHLRDRSVLEALAAHQQRGALLATTNYDLLLEHVTGLPPVTWRDAPGVERALRGDEPQVLHLHGAWRMTDSVVLGVKSYEDVIRDAHAQQVLRSLRTDRTFVFVGCGAGTRDPNLGAFLKWTATMFAGSEYRHFRLCRAPELEELQREHPDEQRIFPLAYGASHSELAPFLRSLLSPTAAQPEPTAAPPQPPPSPRPTRAPVETPPPPGPWPQPLQQLLVAAFQNSELQQFFADHLPRALGERLPTTDVDPTQFCSAAAALLHHHGACDHALFAALRSARPQRRTAIDELELACLGTLEPPPPAPAAPTVTIPSSDVTLPQFALVLDRSAQWLAFASALRDETRHLLALVHGDDRQDLKLFVQRTIRWANSSLRAVQPRSHEVVPIQCYHDDRCPRDRAQWVSRITQAIATRRVDEGPLPAMLAALASRSAALLVFVGSNNGGLRDGDGGMKLHERSSFAAALDELVRSLPVDPPHPIRILLPVEHAPEASADDALIDAAYTASGHHPGLVYLPLQELDYPSWKEVLPSLRDECQRRGHLLRDSDLVRTFQPTYEAHRARHNTTAHSFAALGKALGELLDHHLPEPPSA